MKDAYRPTARRRLAMFQSSHRWRRRWGEAELAFEITVLFALGAAVMWAISTYLGSFTP